jgi:hypothetical protein
MQPQDGDGDHGGNGGKGGGRNTAGDSGPIPVAPIDDRSLHRNPAQDLTCSDPAGLNVASTPLSRLTNAQYVRSLNDLALPVKLDASLGSSLPQESAGIHGFVNEAANQVVDDKSVEQYEATARSAAKAIVAGLPKLGIAACASVNDAAGESACVSAFLDSFAMRAYRRPLASDEKSRLTDLYTTSRSTWSFAESLTLLTSVVLSAPQFLYRIELGSDPTSKGPSKLTGYEVASRLSYLVWGTLPDPALLASAKSGSLDTASGIADAADRLLKDPRATTGLLDFAAGWLRFNKFAADAPASTKDKTLFPDSVYSDATSAALLTGLQRFAQDALFAEGGGVQKLLSSNKAWVSSASAGVYGANVTASGTDLVAVDLDPKQRRGLLTQAGLLAGFAHPTIQAPIQRGVFVLDHLLCAPPPPPPPMIPPAPIKSATDVETNRQKLMREHENQSGCKACHMRIDSIGFTFENYDAIGRYVTTETVVDDKGKKATLNVDGTGEINDSFDANGKFGNALELIDKLTKSEQVAQCFTVNFFRYALARDVDFDGDGCAIAATTDAVVKDQGSFRSLLLATLKSNAFRYRAPFAN